MINPVFKSTKISELYNNYTLSYNDIFIFSSNIPKTHVEEYSNLSASILNYFTLSNVFNPDGKWQFGLNSNFPNSCINIANTPTNGTDAINIKYIKNIYIKAVEELSMQLFNVTNTGLYLPSYVGMIIISGGTNSNELDTENDVKKIYGNNTSWRKITGRFLVGAGIELNSNNFKTSIYGQTNTQTFRVSKAGIMGGEKQTQLTIKNMPPHRHCFNNGKVSFEFSKENPAEYTGENGTINMDRFPAFVVGITDIKAEPPSFENSIYPTGFPKYGRHHGKGTYLDKDAKPIQLPSDDYYKKISFTAHGNVEENGNDAEPYHNNMPPFIAKHIWERVS